jgi:hypothetical protein
MTMLFFCVKHFADQKDNSHAISYKRGAEWACKPGSVENDHSSRRTVTDALKQPTRIRRGPRHECLFGLASGGVYRTGLLPDSWCALTAPFHPYHAPLRVVRRFTLCCTFRRLTPPSR